MVDFLCKDLLKKTLSPTIDRGDVLFRISLVAKDTLTWCKSIGEEDDGAVVRNLKWFSEKVASAAGGDFESVKMLAMEKVPSLKVQPIRKLSNYNSLLADFQRASEIAATARYMMDTTLNIVNQLTMALLIFIVKKYHLRAMR